MKIFKNGDFARHWAKLQTALNCQGNKDRAKHYALPSIRKSQVINNYSPKWRWILFAIHLRTSQSARAKSDIYFCGIHLCLIALVWNKYWKREDDYFSWEAQTKI